MTTSHILFTFFYNKIRADIVIFLNTNPTKQEYNSFVHMIATHLFEEKFKRIEQSSNLIKLIHNDLSLYMEMVEFIKEHQKPFMSGNIDTTNIHSIFNRFYYLYALSMMKDECIYSSAIPTIIQQYFL